MSALLRRTLALLVVVPFAGCDLYVRPDEAGDDGVGPLLDASTFVPDAADVDAGTPIDARPPVDPPNAGFVTPTTTTRANVFRNGAWMDVGAAEWGCLAQPPNEPVPDGRYTVSGTVRDHGTSNPVSGAAIVASAGGQALGNGTAGTSGGSRGVYRIELAPLPAGARRVRFAVSAMGARKTIAIDRYLGPVASATLDLPLVSEATAASIPAFVGESADPAEGLVLGELRDCQGRHVSGAVVALSQSTTLVLHWPGGVTFYFSAGASSLPVRHNVRNETNRDGRFMLLGPQPQQGAEGTVQAWGFRTDADRAAGTLRLLGSSAAVIEPAVVSHVVLGRQRGILANP